MKYLLGISIIFILSLSCTNKKEQDGYVEGGDEYKYEYRTNGSSEYRYNYDVSGEDEYGNYVEGNVDVEGKYGSGTIIDEDGNEKEVEVEWVDYGEIEATDEDGNTYELRVD